MGPGGRPRPENGPRKPSHPSQAARRKRLAARRKVIAARILACECDPKARPAIADVVRSLGYEVVAHHTLADTLREATTGAFDVIVASLPYLNDEKLGLLQVLRRHTAQVPLVIVTSDGSLEMRRKCQSARPYYYALQPIDETELRTVLVGAVEKRGGPAA